MIASGMQGINLAPGILGNWSRTLVGIDILTVGMISKENVYSSRVTSKGQVTIPQEVRIRLGLKEGDRVEFVIDQDRTLIRPARMASNPFQCYAGVLGTFPGGPSEINEWVSELRDPE